MTSIASFRSSVSALSMSSLSVDEQMEKPSADTLIDTTQKRLSNRPPSHESEVTALPNRQSYLFTNEARISGKTWLVCVMLSFGSGFAFWPAPVMNEIGVQIGEQLGDKSIGDWYFRAWTIGALVTTVWFGSMSDQLGRRWFLIGGNLVAAFGQMIVASARYNSWQDSAAKQIMVGMTLVGMGAGGAQMTIFALPELLPNCWRHATVVWADLTVFVAFLVAPVTARYGWHLDTWQWNFWAMGIAQFLASAGLYWIYVPPAHPTCEAHPVVIKKLDYVGALVYGASIVTFQLGIAWAELDAFGSVYVVTPIIIGLCGLVFFGFSERLWTHAYPLIPSSIFSRGRGRDFAVPSLCLILLTLNELGRIITWNIMIDYLYASDGDWKKSLVLTLPLGFGAVAGGFGLALFGRKLRRWRWQLVVVVSSTVLFHGLLATVNMDNKGAMMAFVFLSQAGCGWGKYLAIATAQLGVPQFHLGAAGGVLGASRLVGIAVGRTVYVSCFRHTLRHAVLERLVSALTAEGVSSDEIPRVMSALESPDFASIYSPGIVAATQKATANAYCHAVLVVTMYSIAIGAVAVLTSFFCKDVDTKLNYQIDVFLESSGMRDEQRAFRFEDLQPPVPPPSRYARGLVEKRELAAGGIGDSLQQKSMYSKM